MKARTKMLVYCTSCRSALLFHTLGVVIQNLKFSSFCVLFTATFLRSPQSNPNNFIFLSYTLAQNGRRIWTGLCKFTLGTTYSCIHQPNLCKILHTCWIRLTLLKPDLQSWCKFLFFPGLLKCCNCAFLCNSCITFHFCNIVTIL